MYLTVLPTSHKTNKDKHVPLHGRNSRSNPVNQNELSSAASFIVGGVDLQDTPLDLGWVQRRLESGETSTGGDVSEGFAVALNNGPVVLRTVLYNLVVACAHVVSNSPELFSEAEKALGLFIRPAASR